MLSPKYPPLSPKELKAAVDLESKEFQKAYLWIEQHMPASFLDEVSSETRVLIARHLLSFSLQDYHSQIHIKEMGISLILDGPDADLKILKSFKKLAIRYYRAFISNEPPPGLKKGKLRIAILYFRDSDDEEPLTKAQKQELSSFAQEFCSDDITCESLLYSLPPRFLRSMTSERLRVALEMFFRARTREQCQYELKKNEDWKEKEAPSLQLVLAWRNVPKAGFLYRLARIIREHNLDLQRVSATYIDPYSAQNICILSLGLHGLHGKAAWEEADLNDFLQELCLTKYFEAEDDVSTTFVQSHLLSGNEGHLIRNMISFIYQTLVHGDPYFYSFDHIVEGMCRHPELTAKICKAFRAKFHPKEHDLEEYTKIKKEILSLLEKLDTGQAIYDLRRKNILKQAVNFVEYTLKTNFYRNNKTAFAFRIDPRYLTDVPYDISEKFPEIPYGIFFIRGMHFMGFNIRFKDLARGGFRTVFPEKMENYQNERSSIFQEAYNLAYTQQKKNKDIPEGGAKTTLLLKPFEVFSNEEKVYRKELEEAGVSSSIIEEKLSIFTKEHKKGYLFASQRSFIESLLTLVNCDESGNLKAKAVVDYWKRPEYIYLGPDENMYNEMIVWIADYAVRKEYKPGRSFMTSKPGAGINHKEFGVTSYGVNVYLHQVLLYLGIDPEKDPFTVKISGGPDGDVAGNQILNLLKFYPNTAKLLALTDVSGTIFDPKGLDLHEMASLFHKTLPIRHYPPEKLSEGGFLLDLKTKREESAYAQQTLCWKKLGKKAVATWISGNEMNLLFRNNVHQVKCDIFIPAGGRPRSLNEANYRSYLDATGKPSSKAIVEGANLYLTQDARRALEKLGVLIIKDSSCNKGGVICSSFEVLAGLVMKEEKDFLQEKEEYVKEILEIIRKASLNEAKLLLTTHEKTGKPLTDISEKVSQKINLYKYQLLDYFETISLPSALENPLIRSLFLYCPRLLKEKYSQGILGLPDIHKKAIIACYLASHLVYLRGLDWTPNIADLLPTIGTDPNLMGG